MANVLTRDLGLAIRDFCENQMAMTFEEIEGELEATNDFRMEFVDCSDPDNLVFYLDNGQVFTVRIVAGV